MNHPTIGATHGIAPERVTLTEAQKREAQAELEWKLYGRSIKWTDTLNETDTPHQSDKGPANA